MVFVLNDGAVKGLSRPAPMPRSSLSLAEDYTADYAAIWRAQGSVRTVIDFLGRNVAQLGIHCFRRVGDTDRQRERSHPLAQLLERPNPYTTPYRFKDALVHDLGIYDRAYWLKMQQGDRRWLLRLPPYLVTPVGDSWLWPEAFEFNGNKGKRTFPADQVVHFRGYAPEGDLAGSSSIESLRSVLAEEFEAGRQRRQVFRNGARASGYLERPKDAPKWSDTARTRFREAWRSQYVDNGADAGGTPILEDGMKFVPAAQNSQQLQYVESRKLTREEVAAAYFIPPTMVGVMESATFSNIKEQHKHLYQDTLGPWLEMITQELMLQLLPDFEDTDDLYLEFNMEEKMRGSFEEQAQQLQAATGGPWMTRNEARAMRNLPAIEGGDELIVPLNVIEGGQASPQDSAPAPGAAGRLAGAVKAAALPAKARLVKSAPEPSEEQQQAGVDLFADFFKRQRRSVLPALGAAKRRGVSVKAADWWDADRWNKELAADLYALAVSLAGVMGPEQAAALGFDPGDYSEERTAAFLMAVAESRAEMVNTATLEQLVAAAGREDEEEGPTPESVFDSAETVRSLSAGHAIVTAVAAFALVEAGRQLAADRATKTWRTTSSNPRSNHSKMNGETVGIDEEFSNRMNWPGDPAGGADEVAGCRCTVDVSLD